MRMLVSRTGYTAELGYEIYLYDAYRDGDKLWAAVLEAGRPARPRGHRAVPHPPHRGRHPRPRL